MNILLIVVISIVVMLLILKAWPRTGKMGINLQDVHCPECNTPMPKIRKPKNLSQVFWGGCTCNNCGCEVDKYGNKKNT